MRRIFSDWGWDERTWVAGPLALWIAAYLVWSIVLMIRDRRMRSPLATVRRLGIGWKLSFFAAVAWMLGWVIWLMLAGDVRS